MGRRQLLRPCCLSHAGQPDGEEQGRALVHIANHAEAPRRAASELLPGPRGGDPEGPHRGRSGRSGDDVPMRHLTE
jgi:hypothetical protein